MTAHAKTTKPAHATRRNNFTVQIKNIPIIFVPGIFGSRFTIPATGMRWDPEPTGEISHGFNLGGPLSLLTTTAETQRKNMHSRHPAHIYEDGPELRPAETAGHKRRSEKERGYAGVLGGFYYEFLRFLHSLSFPPNYKVSAYAVGYDWRQSNKNSGQHLAQEASRIMAQEEASECVLVSHSMGGLVTRSALQQSPGLAGKAVGVIHIAQPVNGAPALYRRFFTGLSSEMDGSGMTDRLFNHMVGSDSRKLGLIASGMPGVFELLPNSRYKMEGSAPWLWYQENGMRKYWAGGDPYQLYLDQNSPPGIVWQGGSNRIPAGVIEDESMTVLPAEARSDLETNVRGARAFHEGLGAYKHSKTWTIYGWNQVTDVGTWFDRTRPPAPTERLQSAGSEAYPVTYQVIEWPNRGVHRQTSHNGDIVVPAASASALYPDQHNSPDTLPNEQNRQFVVRLGANENHGSICDVKDVRKLTQGMIYHVLKLDPTGRPQQSGHS